MGKDYFRDYFSLLYGHSLLVIKIRTNGDGSRWEWEGESTLFHYYFVLTLSCQYCWIEPDLRCFVMWLLS